jgi:hypothetical protein
MGNFISAKNLVKSMLDCGPLAMADSSSDGYRCAQPILHPAGRPSDVAMEDGLSAAIPIECLRRHGLRARGDPRNLPP